jgi:large conductance mechanosensitive channel
MQGFKDFLMKGNVIELAVAVIIGAAFKTIVDKFVEGIVNPLLGMLFGTPNFDDFVVGGFGVGLVITAIINFILTAGVIYFFLVKPAANYAAKRAAAEPPPGPTSEELLAEIRDALKK